MFRCLECGQTMKREREECPQCGGSDIDVAPVTLRIKARRTDPGVIR